MATSPIYSATPKMVVIQVTTANANRDGTGAIVDAVSGATNGSRVAIARIAAITTSTLGAVRWFIHNGAAYRYIDEVIVPAITASASVPPFRHVLRFYGGLWIPTGYKLAFSTEKTETFNIEVEYADV